MNSAQRKRFCLQCLSEEGQRLGLSQEKIYLVLKYMPRGRNGRTIIRRRKQKNRYTIRINARSKETDEAALRRHTFATVVHELTHIAVFRRLTENFPSADYLYTAAGLEQLIGSAAAPFFQGMTDRRIRCTSVSELLCMRESLQRTIEKFGGEIDLEEREALQRAADACRFMLRHMEIHYVRKDRPVNLFFWLLASGEKLAGNKVLRLPMEKLFTDEGRLAGLEALYANDGINEDLKKNLLLRSFMYEKNDVKPLLDREPALFQMLENLSAEYCESAVGFFRDRKLGEILFDDEFLDDNAAMLMKNLDRLKRQMQRYGMRADAGSVLPLYKIH